MQEDLANVLECSEAVEMRESEREREMWRSESEESFWMTLRDVDEGLVALLNYTKLDILCHYGDYFG